MNNLFFIKKGGVLSQKEKFENSDFNRILDLFLSLILILVLMFIILICFPQKLDH
jgi:lipopolysaccharide/colanic/teichoic acid biosynthesis glycosyltransferase